MFYLRNANEVTTDSGNDEKVYAGGRFNLFLMRRAYAKNTISGASIIKNNIGLYVGSKNSFLT